MSTNGSICEVIIGAFSKVFLNFFYLAQVKRLFKYTRFKLKQNIYYRLLIGFGVTFICLTPVFLVCLLPSFSLNDVVIYAADAPHIKMCNVWVPITQRSMVPIRGVLLFCWVLLLVQQSVVLYIYYVRCKHYSLLNKTNVKIIIYGRIANTIVEWS